MLTFFSTPKPFCDHVDVIQRNALRSWQRIHPDAEVLLFGDDKGAAVVARELGIRHVPDVRRNRHGTKYLASIYDQAQELARHDLLCHLNCDIILTSDFLKAAQEVSRQVDTFLMGGRRWDVDIISPLDFSAANWEATVRDLAIRSNHQRPPQWIDYFFFRKGFFHQKIPPFVIGRPGWDNWLLWYALASGARLIDASEVVCAIHQNHDYGYHPDGEKGVWEGEEAQENYRLLEGQRKFRTLENATDRLMPDGLHRNYRRVFVQARRDLVNQLSPAWFRFLDWTRPVRHRLGMRVKAKS
jgi:hypothetical protein